MPALLFPWCWLSSCSGSGVLGFVGAMQMQPHGGGGPSLTQEASRVKELWLFCRNSGDLLDFHSAFSFCLLLNFAPLISALWWVQTNAKLSITDHGPVYPTVNVFCVYITMLYILSGGSEMKNLPAM